MRDSHSAITLWIVALSTITPVTATSPPGSRAVIDTAGERQQLGERRNVRADVGPLRERRRQQRQRQDAGRAQR